MVTLWPIIRGGRARSTKHELRAEILPGPRQQGLCYAVTSGFYPVNCELPDCGLLNGKGLGDDKSSPIKKKKSTLRKFDIYCIYIPTLKNHKGIHRNVLRTLCAELWPLHIYMWKPFKMQLYEVGQKVRCGFSIMCYGKKWTNFLANPMFSGKAFKELN